MDSKLCYKLEKIFETDPRGRILTNRLKLKLQIISTKPRLWDGETVGVERKEGMRIGKESARGQL